ncbi:MAG: DUF2326 domain-containing protein [Bacteroidales bacterium]
MLKEIICNRFKQPRVQVNDGLNIVLGDSNASNSIGKSSFLMIVDFIYGGETYAKSIDIIDNVGHHEIKFCFEFNGVMYYFSRKTQESHTVSICNEKYESTSSISLSDYNTRLSVFYSINLSSISFRNVGNTYLRVYGKDNLNEKYPLESYKGDSLSKGVDRLIKIFDRYDSIEKFDKALAYTKEKYSAYLGAETFDILPKKITKAEYKENIKTLQHLRSEEEQYLNIIGSNSADLNTENIELLTSLRKELSAMKRVRNRLSSRYDMLSNSELGKVKSITQEEIFSLKKFFPTANIQSIEEINIFHKEITKLVDSEVVKQKKEVETDLLGIDNDITKIMQSITDISGSASPSIIALKNLMRIKNRIEEISTLNKTYDAKDVVINQKKEAQSNLKEIKLMTVCDIATKLNIAMSKINDYIYSAKKQSPQIDISEKSYKFRTLNDTGTGTAYKNLIILDLSILKLTQLPILIHDSLLYNNISYDARDKIIECYLSNPKQIFIAIDDKNNYSSHMQPIIEQHKIIELGSNEKSLFGKSWTSK